MSNIENIVKCKLDLSNIHKIGVFAVKDIKKGEELFIINPISFSLTREEFEEIPTEIKEIILDRNVFYKEDENIEFTNPNMDINYICFLNHSDNPNSTGTIALRDIKKGEEITESYLNANLELDDISKNHFKFLC